MDTPTTDFRPLLEKLIAEAPPEHKGGVQCQITLMNGATLAGALFRNTWDIPDMYGLRGIVRKGDPRSGEPTMVDTYFAAQGVFSVTLPTPESAMPRILAPNGAMGPRMG
jgi:hypothetical protein